MQSRTGARWEEFLGRLDRRLVSLGLVLFTLPPLVGKWVLPLTASSPSRALQAAVEAIPPEKLVFISSDWDAGTQAESRPQLTAIVRHLLKQKRKFVLFSVNSPTGPQIAQTTVEKAIKEEDLTEEQWKYGRDWANLGYKVANTPWIRTLSRSIQEAMKEDWQNTPISELEILKGVDRWGPDGQVAMLIDVTGSATIEYWYAYLTPTKVKLGLACTGVMAPEQYPYLDSGQLSGMLTGMKGAAEYFELIGAPSPELRVTMAGQSFAHLYIVLLILLGNVPIFLGWWQRRQR